MNFGEWVQEASLVTGKYDLSDLAIFIKTSVEFCEKIGRLGINLCSADFSSKKVKFIYHKERGKIMTASENTVTIHVPLDKFDDFSVEILLSHELSHVFDKGTRAEHKPIKKYAGKDVSNVPVSAEYYHHPFFRKKQFRGKTLEDKIKSIESFLEKFFEEENEEEMLKFYYSKYTETEAYVGMFDYAINALLKKHPERVEKLKELLREGKLKSLIEVFPELEGTSKFLFNALKIEKIRKKLAKRLVITLGTFEKVPQKNIKIEVSEQLKYYLSRQDSSESKKLRKFIQPQNL